MASFLMVSVFLCLTSIGLVLYGLLTLLPLFRMWPWQIMRLLILYNGLRFHMIGLVLTQMLRFLYQIILGRLVVCLVNRLANGYVAIVQSDSSVAIRMILDPIAASISSSLVRRIFSLQNRPWSLHFLWIPREMNMVVDGLSKLTSVHDFHLQTFDDVPKSLRPLLVRDRDGPSYCRRC
ncbi:hypothetical protein V6N11_031056 [Hibiscus sabdariffa]|uniref:RNase H type-1 domain-containing protein n=2 Tax=Hibiscus sabdariffa TaxID=183260 RepID=A0ABR1ZKT4_9ROSI